MDEPLRDGINRRIDIVNKMACQAETKLKKYPKGRIKICKQGNTSYYYHISNRRNPRLLKKADVKLIDDLIQKRYLEKVLEAFKAESDALMKIKKLYPSTIAEEIYDELTDDRKAHVKPIIPTDEQYVARWLAEPYKRKPISDDVPYYETENGERVRSKSEVIIADRLSLSSVPYKYECPLVLQIDDELITIHPDFTLLRMSDRKVLYFEHCGMMDNAEYADELVKRINQYSRAGIILGDRLFLMFETSKTPLDVRVLDSLINSKFK